MQPALRMAWLKPAIDVGMVVTPGRNRRDGAASRSSGCRAATGWSISTSAGTARRPGLGAARAARRAGHPLRRLSIPRRAAGRANLHVIPSPEWPGGDLVASTDAVGGQGRVQHGLRGHGQRHADDLPAAAGFAEYPRARPGLAGLGGRRAGLVARLPGLAAGTRPGAGLRARARPAAVSRRRRRARSPRHLAEVCRSPAATHLETDGGPRHEVRDPSGRRARAPGRPPGGGPRGRVGQRRDEPEAIAAMPGADAFLGKITPAMLARGRPPAMGADVHGQPGTLHVPRAGGAPLRPDQHARDCSAT